MGTPAASLKKKGSPAVVQWVKNLTAAARVTEEAQVHAPAQHSGLKDLAQVTAAAGIQSLVRDATGVAIKKQKPRPFPPFPAGPRHFLPSVTDLWVQVLSPGGR